MTPAFFGRRKFSGDDQPILSPSVVIDAIRHQPFT
jgi:hypothetical protein